MAYTYEDFVTAANKAGVMGSFSQYDLDLAKKYPEFGLSIIGYKQDYNNATTDTARKAANDAANMLRQSYGSYTGGVDGSQYKSTGLVPEVNKGILENSTGSSFAPNYDEVEAPRYDEVETPGYENAWADKQQDLIDAALNQKPFETQLEKPTYENTYAEQQKEALDALLNKGTYQPADIQRPTYENAYAEQKKEALDALLNKGSYQPADIQRPAYENPYKDQQKELLDQILNHGSFTPSQSEAPSYENAWADKQKELTDAILNREEFAWSKESDPLWAAYKKQYLREGERASANALAQASAASGGRSSTYAINAASQAGDYYAGQLADVLPQLEERAYGRYKDAYAKLLQDLSMVNTQEQLDYDKYQDLLEQYRDLRNFEYQQYLDAFDKLQQQMGTLNSQEQLDYAKFLDALNQYNTDRSFDFNQYLSELDRLNQNLGAVNTQEQLDYSKFLDEMNQYNTDRSFDFNQYLSELDRLKQNLGAVNNQEQLAYGKFLDLLQQYNTDRNFEYGQYQDEHDRILQNLGAVNSQEQMDYDKYLTQLNQFNNDRNFDYNELQDAIANQMDMEQQRYQQSVYEAETAYGQNLAKAELLAAAGDFSGYKALGFSDTEIGAMEQAYRAKQEAAASTKGSGGSDKPAETQESGLTPAILSALENKYPDGIISAGDWAAVANAYGEDALKAAGFSKGGNPPATQNSGNYAQIQAMVQEMQAEEVQVSEIRQMLEEAKAGGLITATEYRKLLNQAR